MSGTEGAPVVGRARRAAGGTTPSATVVDGPCSPCTEGGGTTSLEVGGAAVVLGTGTDVEAPGRRGTGVVERSSVGLLGGTVGMDVVVVVAGTVRGGAVAAVEGGTTVGAVVPTGGSVVNGSGAVVVGASTTVVALTTVVPAAGMLLVVLGAAGEVVFAGGAEVAPGRVVDTRSRRRGWPAGAELHL
jgi:hypothetical protein